MIGYGTYHLPPGTWSDDSSLTFCLAEALAEGFDLNVIGGNFVKWLYQDYWTPYGEVFDVGAVTRRAISRIANARDAASIVTAGETHESSNGNGSLMRILPLVLYLWTRPINERFEITKQVSSLTHGHIRSVIACFYYLEFARQLLEGKDKFEIYKNLQSEITGYLVGAAIAPLEITLFDRLLKHDITQVQEEQIASSGYVLHTLEASIWCLLTTDSYAEAVLKAVNLGEDTDTSGAVTGGLAGLLYGFDGIPANWLKQIAKHGDIENLAQRLACRYTSTDKTASPGPVSIDRSAKIIEKFFRCISLFLVRKQKMANSKK